MFFVYIFFAVTKVDSDGAGKQVLWVLKKFYKGFLGQRLIQGADELNYQNNKHV